MWPLGTLVLNDENTVGVSEFTNHRLMILVESLYKEEEN